MHLHQSTDAPTAEYCSLFFVFCFFLHSEMLSSLKGTQDDCERKRIETTYIAAKQANDNEQIEKGKITLFRNGIT